MDLVRQRWRIIVRHVANQALARLSVAGTVSADRLAWILLSHFNS
jgi:hypothetical protein